MKASKQGKDNKLHNNESDTKQNHASRDIKWPGLVMSYFHSLIINED